MSQERSPGAAATLFRGDEQHFQPVVGHPRERNRTAVAFCDPKGNSGEVVGREPGLDRLAVAIGEEVVRGVNSAPPDPHERRVLRGSDRLPDVQDGNDELLTITADTFSVVSSHGTIARAAPLPLALGCGQFR